MDVTTRDWLPIARKIVAGEYFPAELSNKLSDREFIAKTLATWLSQQPTPVCQKQGDK